MAKIWLVTGANSGFGKLATERLLARGDHVAALVRRVETLNVIDTSHHDERLVRIAFDLADEATIAPAIDQAFAAFGRIDIVLSNAGYGTFGAIEELSPEQIRRQIESNLLGTIFLVRAVLRHLRAQGGGRLIQISSEGGRISYPGFSTYHASKWGQEGFIEAVAQEVAPFGIEMCLVEPGPTGTNFLAGIDMSEPTPAYADTLVATTRERLAGGGFGGVRGDAAKMVDAMIALADAPDLPLRVPMGSVGWDNIRREAAKRLELLAGQRGDAYACDSAGEV